MSVCVENLPPRPVGLRCRLAVAALYVTLIVLGLQIAWSMTGIAMMGGLIDAPPDWPDAYDALTTILAVIYLLSLLISGVLFIRWQRSMTHNLRSFALAGLDPGMGLSTWGWFIPILNLITPYRSMEQIARLSTPENEPPSTALVGWWWAGWLLANLSGWTVNAVYRVAETPDGWIAATTVDAASSTLLIVTGMLAIQMLRRLTRQQNKRRS